MQNKFNDFNLEETLDSLVKAIQDVNLLTRRLVAIIPQDMATKFDGLIDSGVLGEVEDLITDPEIDDLEVMTVKTDSFGNKIWHCIQENMIFPKGAEVELSGAFQNGNYLLSIDFSGDGDGDQILMISIDPDDMHADTLGFRLSLLDIIRRALLGKFTNFDRLNVEQELSELTLEYLVLEHRLGPESVVAEVDKEILFLGEYTKLFDPTPKENFLRVAVGQRPLIKTKTLLSFSQYAENLALTDLWRKIAPIVLTSELKTLIRPKLSERGHYLRLDSPLVSPAEIVNITVNTLYDPAANERFIQGYKALITNALEKLFFAENGSGP